MPDNPTSTGDVRSQQSLLGAYNEARSLIDRIQSFHTSLDKILDDPTVPALMLGFSMVIQFLEAVARIVIAICDDCE